MNWTEQIAAVFSWLPKDPDIIWDGWGIAAVTALFGFVGWLVTRLRKPSAAAIQHDASDWLAKNRLKLCHRFQKELDDRRHSFLLGKEPLELDKTLAPQEVAHPHSLQDSIACTLERDGLAVETTGQPIAALFNRPEVGRRLAILGEPGSGKTVCLLKLCGPLLHEAESDESAPLPVIFECSEWDSRDLLSWMALQLHRKHHFPEDMARQLVQTGDIFPLFDGLDELAAERQRDFVRAFNAFAEGRHLVLCCRLEEYRQLHKTAEQKLALSNAAILQDIAPARLKGHLRRKGLDALWNQIAQSESLLQLARRPLFLGLMMKMSEHLRQGWRRQQGESEEDSLWRLYLNDCLAPTRPDRNQSPDCYGKKYIKEQSLHWLRCLARWMQAEQKVELWIDELQPNMLKGDWRFGILYGLMIGLAVGLMFWLFSRVGHNVALGLTMCLFFWPFCGLFAMRIEKIKIAPFRQLRLPTSWQDWKIFCTNLMFGLTSGLLFVLIIVFSFGLVLRQWHGLGQWLAFWLAVMLDGGVLAGLSKGLQSVDSIINETVHPQERLNDALRSSLLIFPFFLLMAMLLFVQILFFAERMGIIVTPILNETDLYVILLTAVFFIFLSLGTNQVLQHYLLRLCLRWEGQLPLRLVPWLEAMHQRKVLQRVGGSYHFLHKQLQEYLAKQPGGM